MNSKLYFDTVGLANLIAQITAEISRYSVTIDNLYKEYEKSKSYWKGPDADAYFNKVLSYMKTTQLLKLTLQDYVEVLTSVKSKIDNYSKF